MSHVIAHLPRNERRRLLAEEARHRKSGDWGKWEIFDLPDGVPPMGLALSRGWTAHVRRVHKNMCFAVLERQDNGALHLAVSSLSGERPTWWEMQRIKNELAGEDATGVEVYPPQNDVVDGADMFHLWIVPKLGFGI